MEISQIRYADMVARCGTFSAAAERLFVTQPTLSQQIRKLEEEVGFAIFERTTRSVRPTEAGRTFLRYAEPVLAAYDALQQASASLRNRTDVTLRVGVLPTFAHLNLLEILNGYQSLREGVTVSLQIHRSNALLDMLEAGRLDAAIANVFPDQLRHGGDGMEARVLSNDVICVVLHRNDPLAAKEAIRPEDLGTSPVVMLGKDSSIRKHMDDALREAGVRPPAVHECPDIHSMIGMIRADAGVGFLSSRVAAQYVADPVVSRPIEPAIRTMTAVLYLKGGAQDVHLASFAEYLQDSLGGSPLPDGGSRTA